MQSLIEPHNYFYSRDPALDRDVTGLDEAAAKAKLAALDKALKVANETGKPDGLPLKPGRTPVTWRLAPLSERSYRDLTRTGSGVALCADAFRRSVVGAKDATDLDGHAIKLETEDVPGGKVLNQATMDLLFRRYKAGLLLELGMRAVEECELDPQ